MIKLHNLKLYITSTYHLLSININNNISFYFHFHFYFYFYFYFFFIFYFILQFISIKYYKVLFLIIIIKVIKNFFNYECNSI